MRNLETMVRVEGTIVLQSALHVGTGRPGRAATDHGVMLDPAGRPILPGSSLKGVFRSTAESLAGHLGMKACFLAGENGCVTGKPAEEKKAREALAAAEPGEVDGILREVLCDVCRLFGSPLAASRLQFIDAVGDWDRVPEVRDGVSLDRDARTARPGLKFDFEVIPAGTSFKFELTGRNLSSRERALAWAVLREWQRGFAVGGKVSRGLGAARLENLAVREVNLRDQQQRVGYLVNGTMVDVEPDALDRALEEVLAAGGSDA